MQKPSEEIQIGDKVRVIHAMTDEAVYVLGLSWMDELNQGATVFVVGDTDGDAMPLEDRHLMVVESTDITRARARRLYNDLVAQLDHPSQLFRL